MYSISQQKFAKIILFDLQGFGDILNLVPIAESVVKLNAVCVHCYGEASFTKRKGSETAVSSACVFPDLSSVISVITCMFVVCVNVVFTLLLLPYLQKGDYIMSAKVFIASKS